MPEPITFTPEERVSLAYGIAARELYGHTPKDCEGVIGAIVYMDAEALLTLSDEALLHRLGRAIRAGLPKHRGASC